MQTQRSRLIGPTLLKAMAGPTGLTGLAALLSGLALMLMSGEAGAAPGLPSSPEDLLRSTPSSDLSTQMFMMLLGDFFRSPMASVGGSMTVIGAMFLVFNMAVFIIGVLWAGYGIVSGIVETAQQGQILGRRQSTVWMPIRLGLGFVGIVPVFAGFSPAQALIVVMTTLGIGMANAMYTGALGVMKSYGSFMPVNLALPTGMGVNVKDMTHGLFRVAVCQDALEKHLRDTGSTTPAQVRAPAYATAGVEAGKSDNPSMCGYMAMNTASSSRGSSSATSYRVASVAYDGIAESVAARMATAYQTGFNQLYRDVTVAARSFKASRDAAQADPTKSTAYPEAELDAASQKFQATIASALQSAQQTASGGSGAIASAAMTNMEADGWMGAGSWAQTWMEVNAAFADAATRVSMKFKPPTPDEFSDKEYSEIRGVLLAIEKSQGAATPVSESAPAGETSGNLSSLTSFLCSYVTSGSDCGSATTPTGNFSVGQWFVVKAIKMSAVGSGGGAANAPGVVVGDDIGLVNPIVAFKNLGDYTMTIGEGLALVSAAASNLPLVGDGDGGVAGSAMKLGGKIPGLGWVARFVSGMAQGVIKIIGIMVPYLVVLGLFMAVYIPMIPFMTWMGGIVQYAVVVLQGLAGASIAALSHMDAEGEGLGQRTSAGYMFLLNVTFRPALMLLGFFLATGLLIGLGTIQVKLFLPAMANAQGNSITGLLSIFGFLTIFAIINFTMIQGLYNMTFLFPDQILGLVGTNSTHAELGRETEGKVHGVFVGIGRHVQTMTQTIGSGGGSRGAPARVPSPGRTGGAKPKGTST